MKKYRIKRYETADYARWNAFISSAKNATFLFHRDFMEYHNDRFVDYSIMIFKGEEVVGLLPAHILENVVSSHNGLTYGGFVFSVNLHLGESIEIVQKVLEYFSENQITTLRLKIIPSIYCEVFSEEISYCLFLAKATPIRRDCLSVIALHNTFSIDRDRRRSIRKSEKSNLEIKEEYDFDVFWEKLLIPNLEKTYGAVPVHTSQEITKLHQVFPNNIRHFNVYQNDKLVAGSTIFITDRVAHPQYIAADEHRNESGSLDFLYHYLITVVFKDKQYFDFGPSHEDFGKKINSGILFWKESFGAKTVTQDYYEIETKNHHLLKNVLV